MDYIRYGICPFSRICRFKDGKPIRSQVKYSTSPAWERRASLKVSRAKLEDAGVFTCRATNTVGTAETSCRLTVCQKPTLTLELDKGSSSQVTSAPGKNEVLAGRVGGRLVVKATCEAVPECEPMTWFIKGNRVESELTPDLRSRVTINQPASTTSRTASTPTVQEAYLTISDLQLQDSGDIGVRAVNSAGFSQTALRLVLSDRPQPPMSVKVGPTRGQDWLEVLWERPASDGGSKLTGYLVERRVVSGPEGTVRARDMEWTSVGQVGPYDDRLRVRNCVPQMVYSFRVSAQNDIGTSDATEIESPHHMKPLTDVPSPPTNVAVDRTSARDATVRWNAPLETGGDVLQGYLVEIRESPDPSSAPASQWTHVSLVRSGTTYRANDLHPNMVVQFRVKARNAVGFSEPSEPSDWVPPVAKEPDESERAGRRREPTDREKHLDKGRPDEQRDILAEMAALREAAKPKRDVTGKTDVEEAICKQNFVDVTIDCCPIPFFRSDAPVLKLLTGDEYRLRPANNLRVGAHVTYSTRATVSLLTGSGQPLTGSVLGRCRVEQFGDDFYINLRNVDVSDAGNYMIRAENSAGASSAVIRLFVSTEPLPPTGPLSVKVVEPVKGHTQGATVELSWNPSPLRPGESTEYAEPVLGYVVERRDGQRRTHFGCPIRLEGAKTLSTRVTDLKPGIEYVFRVSSHNAVGPSEPLLSEPIVLKTPFGVPDAPVGPLNCSDITDSSLTLKWQPPLEDGGLPLKRYQLEIKDVGHPAGWVPLTSVPENVLSYVVSGLQPGFAYRFRVRAVNDEGPGEWLETEKSIPFCRPTTNPSEPVAPLRLLPDGDNAVRLSWRPPLDDGGAPIKDYIVEVCLDQSSDHWKPVGTTDGLSKRVDGLLPDGVYSFRVSARNEAEKVSIPLYSEIYKPASPVAPPGAPVGPLVARSIGIGQIQLDWKSPQVGGPHGYGVPEEYLIERYDSKRARWAYVARQPVSDGTSIVVTGLQSGGEYRFRVRAENRAGAGPALEMEKPVIATSPFSPPGAPVGPINISEVQKGPSKSDGSVRLSWRPPADTGGLPVQRYVTQMRYANTPGWHRIGRRQASLDEAQQLDDELAVPTTTLATSLMQGQRYVFRVAAVNAAGTGPFLESDVFEMPEDESCRPKADWVRVVGKSADSVTVEWLVPHDCRHDHGPHRAHHLAIDNFRVFVRPATPAGAPEAPWKRVADLDHYMNRLVVGDLRQDRSYYFGVAAVNQAGQGDIVSTKEPVSPEVITTVPSQPVGPLRAHDITDVGCTLTWSSPVSDGGSPLLGYRIYKREMYRRSWQEIGRLTETPGLPTAKQLSFAVQYLMQATSYEFRVVAENKNGLSEPLDTHVNIHPAKATDTTSPYGGTGSTTKDRNGLVKRKR
ncbi:fibronectin type III domain protein [Opisthorchis viverrini]|uniref:Fibronectin type III domain protein n=1 Tax=Opisthorchis viverrini TaxID=6198 RepID=A0A1S8XA34_OPIVI|nr:fibronectin type III domain protein [Opisthorchis viverrini]